MPSDCVKHKPDARCMAGDFFFTYRNDRFRQIEIKREIIMEKRMHDICQRYITMVYNHCKNLLEELYLSAILLRVF